MNVVEQDDDAGCCRPGRHDERWSQLIRFRGQYIAGLQGSCAWPMVDGWPPETRRGLEQRARPDQKHTLLAPYANVERRPLQTHVLQVSKGRPGIT